jgi:hypothetical protein
MAAAAAGASHSHRHHHRRRRGRHHYIASTMTTELSEQELEDRLFSHFRGWNWPERARHTNSWIWNEGYDIQKVHLERWVCRTCIRTNRPQVASFKATRLQNARTHLWKAHHIGAPDGEKKSEAQVRDEVIPSQPSVASLFGLDVSQRRDQQIANTVIRSFDKRYIYRLLIDFIITSNNPFNIVDNIAFRKLMEYLNPAVRIRRAILPAQQSDMRFESSTINTNGPSSTSYASLPAKYTSALTAGRPQTRLRCTGSSVSSGISRTCEGTRWAWYTLVQGHKQFILDQ